MGELLIVGDTQREAPEEFKRKLRAFDPDLLVAYDLRRHRWKIEQCVRHLAPGVEHSHVCDRVYVWLVQTPEGDYLGLDNWEGIREKLCAMDTRAQGFSPDEKGLERYRAELTYEEERARQKRNEEMAKVPGLMWRDNKLTRNRLIRLLDKHGIEVLLDSSSR
jgi:hypothetical protein